MLLDDSRSARRDVACNVSAEADAGPRASHAAEIMDREKGGVAELRLYDGD